MLCDGSTLAKHFCCVPRDITSCLTSISSTIVDRVTGIQELEVTCEVGLEEHIDRKVGSWVGGREHISSFWDISEGVIRIASLPGDGRPCGEWIKLVATLKCNHFSVTANDIRVEIFRMLHKTVLAYMKIA